MNEVRPEPGKEPHIIRAEDPLNRPRALAYGTLVTSDLARTRHIAEAFLGLECAESKPDVLMARDRTAAPNSWAIEITEVDEIRHPQHVLNHWGIDVSSAEEVDEAYETACAQQDAFGFSKVNAPRQIHGVYQIYFRDFDQNWWEVQHQKRNAGLTRPAPSEQSVVTPAYLSHGTLDIQDLDASCRFYTEFLGVDVRYPSSRSMWILKNEQKLFLVCVKTGDKLRPQTEDNRWVLDFAAADDVAKGRDLAVKHKDAYGIREVTDVVETGGHVSFRLQDLDHNWWEFTTAAQDRLDRSFGKT